MPDDFDRVAVVEELQTAVEAIAAAMDMCRGHNEPASQMFVVSLNCLTLAHDCLMYGEIHDETIEQMKAMTSFKTGDDDA